MITYNFFKYLYLNIKYTKILKKIYKNENILNNLSELFNAHFKIDWVGRMYAILNPNLINEEFDINTQIFEYDENGLNNTAYVEKWIMTKLNIASNFIKANNLFDLLTYDLKKLDNYDNYLFVIKPITFDDCIKYSKKFGYLILGLIIIAIIVALIIIL